MTKDLAGVAIYESPMHLRKFAKRKIEPDDSGERITDSFKTSVDTEITEWLKSNTLVKMIEAMPGHYHMDYSYVFQGSNNTLCAIHPKMVNVEGGSVGLFPRHHKYLWKVTIRYQPIANGLPKELTDALSKLGFKRKE